MREPAFWREPRGMAGVLSPLATVYGAIAARRMAQPGAAAGAPVFCVGNLTVGGAGKTPTAIALAKLLLEAGRRPFMLSRGYGGRLAGPVRVDAAIHGAADVGDEPLLLARVAPAIVSRDRVAGAAAACAAGADVLVMDDGFQNPALRKDFSLLVVDGTRGIGNGLVLPAGPLRAPLETQLARADALLVIGDPAGAQPVLSAASGLPVFHGRLEPDQAMLAALRPCKVLAFAGIGDPGKFFVTLADAGVDVRVRRPFGDHHNYRRSEAAGLLARAAREELVLVTTEKDVARMQHRHDLRNLARAARALPVALVVVEAEAFRALVLARVA
jgi:tetraacyldisaccharide 4'-kinase